MAPDTADAHEPTSGWILEDEAVHVFPVRVYYEDTDAGGIVYYVNYLKFAERARTEMLRLMDRQQQTMMEEDGIVFVVKKCELDYHAPAKLDDSLQVRSRVVEVGGASLRLEQRLVRDDQLLAEMKFRLAVLNRAGRAARLPADIRERLEAGAR
jgi:acyl-CoA thioester hydrolase